MPIPGINEIKIPFMQIMADGQEHKISDIIKQLADTFNLTDEERSRRFPSGNKVFANNVGQVRIKFKEIGYITDVGLGLLKITEGGSDIMKSLPVNLDHNFLSQFGITKIIIDNQIQAQNSIEENNLSPEERIYEAYSQYRKTLADELLEIILRSTPSFLEHLAIKLLVAMGYGGSREYSAEHWGGPGDKGIDGLIKQDKLGLDSIVIQTKKYAAGNNISFETMTAFAGAMVGKNAHKGVFITTSDFTSSCIDYAKSCQKKIVLINGTQLTNLMIDYGIGVSAIQTIEIKKIDNDYFDDVE